MHVKIHVYNIHEGQQMHFLLKLWVGVSESQKCISMATPTATHHYNIIHKHLINIHILITIFKQIYILMNIIEYHGGPTHLH